MPKAIAAFRREVALSDRSPRNLAYLGHAYALAGNKSEARKILEEITKRSRQQYVSPNYFALVYVGLGEKQQALEWLEKAYDLRAFELVTIYKWDEFSSLHSEPQFQDLLRRMGLTPQEDTTRAAAAALGRVSNEAHKKVENRK